MRGRGCGGGTARHRRHTGAAGGNTAPVGAVIATAAAVRDVAVHINVTAYVAVRRDITVGRYVALKIGAVEIAPVDVGAVDVAPVDVASVDAAAPSASAAAT